MPEFCRWLTMPATSTRLVRNGSDQGSTSPFCWQGVAQTNTPGTLKVSSNQLIVLSLNAADRD